MILSRSPYIIEIDEPLQTGSKIELFMWNTGTQPVSPQYTLSKLIPSSNNTATYYNVSPYVKEFYTFGTWQNLYNTYDAAINTDYVVNMVINKYKYIGGVYTLFETTSTIQFMDGYNYYMDGYNEITAPRVYLTEGTYFYNHTTGIGNTNVQNMAGTFDVELGVGDVIRYTNLSTGAVVSYAATVQGIKTFSRVYVLNISYGNKVELLLGGSALRWTGIFKTMCEPKYSVVAVDFLNRYGSWARIFFQKAKKRTINVTNEKYKVNPSTLPFFSSDEGQVKEFNTNAKESIKLNTGWVNDLYGEYIQELLLSEKVTLYDYEYSPYYNPVNVQTKSLKKQMGINDGTMNYELTFNFAYDLINNVV